MPARLNEDQWLRYNDPPRLLNHLRRPPHNVGRSKAGRRKLRLFACACCRLLVWGEPVKEEFRRLVELAEVHADGRVSQEELVAAFRARTREYYSRSDGQTGRLATVALLSAAPESAVEAARGASYSSIFSLPEGARPEAKRLQCRLLRDVFGNPFRPVPVPPAWLAWNNGTIPKLARGVYDDRRFSDLPILADALEEAGCADADVLTHCRDGGVHVRGCWVLDLLLGWHLPA